jgi:hypothetical protein
MQRGPVAMECKQCTLSFNGTNAKASGKSPNADALKKLLETA